MRDQAAALAATRGQAGFSGADGLESRCGGAPDELDLRQRARRGRRSKEQHRGHPCRPWRAARTTAAGAAFSSPRAGRSWRRASARTAASARCLSSASRTRARPRSRSRCRARGRGARRPAAAARSRGSWAERSTRRGRSTSAARRRRVRSNSSEAASAAVTLAARSAASRSWSSVAVRRRPAGGGEHCAEGRHGQAPQRRLDALSSAPSALRRLPEAHDGRAAERASQPGVQTWLGRSARVWLLQPRGARVGSASSNRWDTAAGPRSANDAYVGNVVWRSIASRAAPDRSEFPAPPDRRLRTRERRTQRRGDPRAARARLDGRRDRRRSREAGCRSEERLRVRAPGVESLTPSTTSRAATASSGWESSNPSVAVSSGAARRNSRM